MYNMYIARGHGTSCDAHVTPIRFFTLSLLYNSLYTHIFSHTALALVKSHYPSNKCIYFDYFFMLFTFFSSTHNKDILSIRKVCFNCHFIKIVNKASMSFFFIL